MSELSLNEAVDAFDKLLSTPAKWTKHRYFIHSCDNPDAVESSCLMGAVHLVAPQDGTCSACDPAFVALRQHLYEAIVDYDKPGVNPYSSPSWIKTQSDRIMQFNDLPTTTFTDIRAVIELMRTHLAVEAVDAVEAVEVPELEDA